MPGNTENKQGENPQNPQEQLMDGVNKLAQSSQGVMDIAGQMKKTLNRVEKKINTIENIVRGFRRLDGSPLDPTSTQQI